MLRYRPKCHPFSDLISSITLEAVAEPPPGFERRGLQLVENWKHMRRFGSAGVIGIDFSVSDPAVRADHVAGWQRQRPTPLSIELRQIGGILFWG
jgi:hypothetical protein